MTEGVCSSSSTSSSTMCCCDCYETRHFEGERVVYFIELTIPFEDVIEKAIERKKLKYAELVAKARQHDWQAHTRPVDIGDRGFVAKSTKTSAGIWFSRMAT